MVLPLSGIAPLHRCDLDLGADIAEAADMKAKYENELATGRAQERVLSDIALAIRLGISGAPSFLEEGTFISGERDLLETYLAEKFPAPARNARRGGPS